MQEEENSLRQRRSKRFETNDNVTSNLSSRAKDSKYLWSDFLGFILLLIFIILIKFFYLFDTALPNQIKLSDADSHPGRFIGERAELQLKRLTNLGTRVVGSYENEVLAVDFLKREISFIAQEANKIHKIEVDIQKPTGSYYLLFKPHGFKNYYANIQNVVVKLSSGNSTHSVLMNCHYDTVPESPGASDNGVNCVVMLEILRVLATGKTPLKHNVIFLFNGAEENPLQASHGFLSQHKWRKEVKVVINLDSAGAGGKEILFQTSGEPWLAKVYAKAVPRPLAGVHGEELFQFGIIPSDTDFRIFRDFANYPGFDIAHCTNGYIYHTKFDTMDFIHPGVYQNTGDNLLALVKELANSSELQVEHSKTRIVYFDVFTLFMIVYTEEFGVVLNLVTVFLSFCAVYKSLGSPAEKIRSAMKNFSISIGGQVLSLVSAGVVVFITTKILDLFKSTMSWYLRPWLIIPLYSFPIVVTMMAVLVVAQKFMKEELSCHKTIHLINGAQFLWTFILLLGTLLGVRTSFILMLTVLFPSIGSLFFSFFKRTSTVKSYLIIYSSCLIFPVLFMINQAVRTFTVMIPMTARMGPHTNPEVIIGGLTFLTSVTYLSQIVPVLLLLKKLKKFLISLCVIHIIMLIVIITTKFGFPYDGDIKSPSLQRFYILHCERTFHDAKGSVRRADSGIFVKSLDRNNVNYVSKFLKELENATTAADDCSTEIFCGFPIFTSRFINSAPYSYWIPAAAPTIHHPTSLEVVNQSQILVNVRKIRILVTGPDHITIGLSPREGVELIKWSFDSSPPVPVYSSNDRKTYMVYYSHGLMGGTLEFDLELRIGQNHSDHVMDVAVIGHYMHDKKFQTKEFKTFLSKFHNWAHLTPWTTTYKSWIL